MTVNSIRRPVTPTNPQSPAVTWPTVKLGSKGTAVQALQQMLRGAGYNVATDGDFGPKTKAAVVAFQQKNGLTADGIVGPKSWAALRGTPQTNTTSTPSDGFDTKPKPQTQPQTQPQPKPQTTTPTTTTPTSNVDAAAAERLEKARSLVRAGGTGTQADAEAVARAMQNLPAALLEKAQGKVDIVACRGAITDYMTELKGVRPRGWPPGSTWDIVPGVFNPNTNEVVVGTLGSATNRRVPAKGEGHGSADVVFHELAHALDDASVLNPGTGRASHDADFRAAYAKDLDSLRKHNETYLLQEGDAGPQEAYAETFARYFRRDPTLRTELPGMYEYWRGVEAGLN